MQRPITTMMTRILVYSLIPAYTTSFTRGYDWSTTNFSVIGNLTDRKFAFFLWGVMVGIYYYMIHRAIRKQVRLKPLAARLLPTALLLLFCAVTTPYLPERLSLESFLHIIFAFVSTVLLLVFLVLVSWSQYPSAPRVYRPFLPGFAVIVVASAMLLAMAGIVSSVLEISPTVTTVILSSRLVDRLRKPDGPDVNNTCIMK